MAIEQIVCRALFAVRGCDFRQQFYHLYLRIVCSVLKNSDESVVHELVQLNELN